MTNELRAALYLCRAILTKLQLIDDAPTSHLRTGPKPPHYADSKEPEGVRLNGTYTGAPSKLFSLWGHYAYRMRQAQERQDASELLKLAACATRDYEVYAHIRPAFHESHEAAITELLRDCRGVPSLDAAWQLGTSEKWVRRQRVLSGHDADHGEPVNADPRMRRILLLKSNGATTKAIALEVGLSTGQVSNLLNGKTSSSTRTAA